MSDRKTDLQVQSMDEILSSIRKIISEDGVSRSDTTIEEPETNTDGDANEDEVLVLTQLIDQKTVLDQVASTPNEAKSIEDGININKETTDRDLGFENEETFLSNEILKRSNDSITALLTNLNDLEANAFNQKLDSLTIKLLRPLVKEWLDNNLPTIVDQMVRDEIKRLTTVSSK